MGGLETCSQAVGIIDILNSRWIRCNRFSCTLGSGDSNVLQEASPQGEHFGDSDDDSDLNSIFKFIMVIPSASSNPSSPATIRYTIIK